MGGCPIDRKERGRGDCGTPQVRSHRSGKRFGRLPATPSSLETRHPFSSPFSSSDEGCENPRLETDILVPQEEGELAEMPFDCQKDPKIEQMSPGMMSPDDGDNSNKRHSSSSIADNLMLDILSRVPARSLIRFRCVCKLWNSLFCDSHFITLQLSHAAKNPVMFFYLDNVTKIPSIYPFKIKAGEVVVPYSKFCMPAKKSLNIYRMSNACEGLMAFYDDSSCVHVVNPCTREWMSPPRATRHRCTKSVGFGFCMATRKYKLVRILVSKSCELLTLGTDQSWRPLEDVPCCIAFENIFIPTYAKGFIYWTIADDANNFAGSIGVVAFDVCKEKFTMEIPLPELHKQPFGVYRCLCTSLHEGSLCLFDWCVHSGDIFEEARLSYLQHVKKHDDAQCPKEEEDSSSVWKEIVTIKVPKSSEGWAPLTHCLFGHQFRGHCMFPAAIQEGKLILNSPFRGSWLHDLHTAAPSWMALDALNDEELHIRKRAIPFACAQSIIPLSWLKV